MCQNSTFELDINLATSYFKGAKMQKNILLLTLSYARVHLNLMCVLKVPKETAKPPMGVTNQSNHPNSNVYACKL